MDGAELRKTHFIYCLKRQPDGRHIMLNRLYKPIGFATSEHVDYDIYPIAVKLLGLGPKLAAKISWKGDPNTECIYLYNNGCIPTASDEAMGAYLGRLEILAKLCAAWPGQLD